MARVELPSGAWVEYRDKLLAADRFAVQAVTRVDVKGDGGYTASFMEAQNDQRNALLGRVITGWSFGCAIPSQDSFRAADVVIGEAMDIDDYSVLEQAVEPLMEKINGKASVPDPKKQSSA